MNDMFKVSARLLAREKNNWYSRKKEANKVVGLLLKLSVQQTSLGMPLLAASSMHTHLVTNKLDLTLNAYK